MSATFTLTPAQCERRIKQQGAEITRLQGLVRQVCGHIGEPDAVRKQRWENRVIEAKRLGQPIPAAPSGVYTDQVWLETGETL